MISSSTTLTRVYDIRGTKLTCPMQNASLEESVRALSQTNPLFRHTKLYEEDGVVSGTELVFKLQLPPPKSKG
ncbi:MAG: hypothetical protein JXQ95_06850 [Alteromonas stellipolaris]|uniref:hypothetical protein n=1 Tax=Alteromonas stellipolaris TaxID=233316 RepID=UPI003B8B4272